MRVLVEFGIPLVLFLFALIDCIQTPEHEVRHLPKVGWILIIIVVPLAGSIAWLAAGRPSAQTRRREVAWPATATSGFPEYERPRRSSAPDDDPAFLRGLDEERRRHEELLSRWERDLRRREEQLRAGGAEAPVDQPAAEDEGPAPA